MGGALVGLCDEGICTFVEIRSLPVQSGLHVFFASRFEFDAVVAQHSPRVVGWIAWGLAVEQRTTPTLILPSSLAVRRRLAVRDTATLSPRRVILQVQRVCQRRDGSVKTRKWAVGFVEECRKT